MICYVHTYSVQIFNFVYNNSNARHFTAKLQLTITISTANKINEAYYCSYTVLLYTLNLLHRCISLLEPL